MQTKKAAVNGIAGRIGKFTAYELVKLGGVICAVNDLTPTDAIVASLSHRDSVHGTLDWHVEKISDEEISINGNRVRVHHERDPAHIKWGNDVYAVDECTGFFVQREAAEKHFAKNPGLETVLLSAPGKEDIPTLVMGVNHTDYVKVKGTERARVISNASCTTKALAVPMKTLIDDGVTIYAVLMDTTHAATNTQKPLDFMSVYGTLDCITSAKTGAAIATGKVIPYLDRKMDGFAMRVPTRDGSFANAYFVAEGPNMSVEYINDVFERAVSNFRYCSRIDVFLGEEIASPDVIGSTVSSLVALSKTKLLRLPFKSVENPANQVALVGIVSGYDNERGPAKDLAMLTQYVMEMEK